MSDNNQAVVAFLGNITAIEGADKIVKADVILNGIKLTQIVVAVGTQENTKIVYFDSNLCLSDDLVTRYPDLKTYLAKGNRVRTIKLRGVISNGLAVNVDHFSVYDNPSTFTEGYSFTQLNGVDICRKYTPPVKMMSQGAGKGKKGRKPPKSRMVDGQFHFHIDTAQLLKNAYRLDPKSVISITRKMHGTSAIASNCLVKAQRRGLGRLLFWKDLPKRYDMVYASRSVIKNGGLESGGFYGYDLWKDAGEKYFKSNLAQGETIYYEILGFTPTGGCIQKGYDYGCGPNEYKIAVYRITKTGPDGHIVEYSWQAVKGRCIELGVTSVPEYYFGRATELFNLPVPASDFDKHQWVNQFVDNLKTHYLEKPCTDCKGGIPDEGIVLRVESLGIEVYKLKSEAFVLGESKAKDTGAEDMEEGQG